MCVAVLKKSITSSLKFGSFSSREPTFPELCPIAAFRGHTVGECLLCLHPTCQLFQEPLQQPHPSLSQVQPGGVRWRLQHAAGQQCLGVAVCSDGKATRSPLGCDPSASQCQESSAAAQKHSEQKRKTRHSSGGPHPAVGNQARVVSVFSS